MRVDIYIPWNWAMETDRPLEEDRELATLGGEHFQNGSNAV